LTALELAARIVRQFEGCCLTPYEDVAGKWTVGVGHLLPDDAPLSDITNEEAESLFFVDLALAQECVQKHVTVPLTDNQTAALTSFVFNLGCGAFKRSTLLKKLNSGDKVGACQEFTKWSYANGRQVNGLLRRRTAEAALFARP
jgi:GH24 family phage-related lysozyme (muramidase)